MQKKSSLSGKGMLVILLCAAVLGGCNLFSDEDYSGRLEGYVYFSGTAIPVSGVTVQVGRVSQTTSSDGYYLLENIPTGVQALHARKAGYDEYRSFTTVSGTYDIEITAEKVFILSGTVTGCHGEPVRGAEVVLLNPDGSGSEIRDFTDSSGKYQLPMIPQGEREISFRHEYYRNALTSVYMMNADRIDYEVRLDQLQIGDTGPAGGWIFYIDKENEFEWTYLEAAPGDAQASTWSNITNELIGTTETGVGSGKANTEAIIAQAGHTTSSAQRAVDYTSVHNEIIYEDWFLPSRDELNLMYENLHLKGLGNFAAVMQYWSSSEHIETQAWRQSFNSGTRATLSKTNSGYLMRPVRAF